MTSNKRIHDLLEYIKKRNQAFLKDVIEDGEIAVPIPTYYMSHLRVQEEILQHLLEMDIENNSGRPICPNCKGNKEVWYNNIEESMLPQNYIIESNGFTMRSSYEKDFCLKCNDEIFKKYKEDNIKK